MATQLAEMPDSLGGGEVAEQDTTAAEAAPERDFEQEARVMGWRPKDEYDGPPGAWKDAQDFIEFRETNLGLKAKEVYALRNKVTHLTKMVGQLKDAEKRAFDNARKELERDLRHAVEAGDLSAFDFAKDKLDTLTKEAGEAVSGQRAPSKEEAEDAFDEFRDKHIWYDKGGLASASEVEVEARLYADRLAERWMRQGLHNDIAPSEFFARIGEETREKFPALGLKAQRGKPASDVAAVTGRSSSRGAKIGANLPADAKEHAERYMRLGIFKVRTKAEAYDLFAKSYSGPW